MTEEKKSSEVETDTKTVSIPEVENSRDDTSASQAKTYQAKNSENNSEQSVITVRKSPVVAYLIASIALMAVIALGYLSYQKAKQIEVKLSALSATEQSYQDQIASFERLQSNQSNQVSQLLAQQQQRFDNELSVLANQILLITEDVSNAKADDNSDWYAAEAYYLLRLANSRLIFTQDIETAQTLLMESEKLLAQIEDAKLFAIRKKINEEIQSLSALNTIDRTGLAIRVTALQTTISQLPMVQILETETVITESETEDVWYEHLGQSMKQLADQWFVVREHVSGYNPVLSESDEQQLRFAMMMGIQAVQYAILNFDDALYQANLLQIKSRIQNYFDSKDAAVQALILEIDELLERQVSYQLSDGLESPQALSRYLTQEGLSPSESVQETSTEESP